MRLLGHVWCMSVRFVALLAMAAPLGFSQVPASQKPDAASSAAVSSNAFAARIYGRLREGEGNIFFSPYSIHSALAMTCAGARGDTEKEMTAVLQIAPGEEFHRSAGALIRELNSARERGLELVVANALWGQEGFGILDDYLAVVRDFYGAELRQLDFVRAAEQARETINSWVARQTRDKIRDLLPPGVLDRFTRLVLTNAAYFKAAWTHPFQKGATRDAPFTLMSGDRVMVPMMEQEDSFGYAESESYQVLSMPYGRGEASMLVLLPRDSSKLSEIEASLSGEKLEDTCTRIQPRTVHVYLPRFEFTCQFDLKATLSALGMSSAFDAARADFSGMTGQKDLFISAVLHKAYVRVDEEGTEAAAATAVVMKLTAAIPQEPVVFRADHPFLFLVRHKRTGAVLFMGRCANPSARR